MTIIRTEDVAWMFGTRAHGLLPETVQTLVEHGLAPVCPTSRSALVPVALKGVEGDERWLPVLDQYADLPKGLPRYEFDVTGDRKRIVIPGDVYGQWGSRHLLVHLRRISAPDNQALVRISSSGTAHLFRRMGYDLWDYTYGPRTAMAYGCSVQ